MSLGKAFGLTAIVFNSIYMAKFIWIQDIPGMIISVLASLYLFWNYFRRQHGS